VVEATFDQRTAFDFEHEVTKWTKVERDYRHSPARAKGLDVFRKAMHGPCMASTTISVNAEAYKLLKEHKKAGGSFSDVIIEHVRPPAARTFGELLDRLETEPPPKIDRKLMAKIRTGRSRPSNRKARPAG
jgi:predicted CopG family antitoxin